MKTTKYILIFIAFLLVACVGYVAIYPSDYDISRSKTIKAPVGKVFNVVNEMKTWQYWGPWHDEDSTIVVTYGEKTVGVGAFNSWTSKDGPGNMTTVNITPNELIEQKMQFEQFEPSDVIWKFEDLGEETKVTWQMKENKAPLVFKIFAAFTGGWDAMLGPMQEQGLNNLEKYMKLEMQVENSFRFTNPKIMSFEGKSFIGFHHKIKIDQKEIEKIFVTDLPKMGLYAMKSGLKYGDFVPGSAYVNWDEEKGEAEFYIGLLLHKKIKPGDGMKEIQLPKGKIIVLSKYGKYGNGDSEAHDAIAKFIMDNQLEKKSPFWELYMNDPTVVKPQQIQTDIFYPVSIKK